MCLCLHLFVCESLRYEQIALFAILVVCYQFVNLELCTVRSLDFRPFF